jgi:DNA-directed RNA polymerase specialized sigma24 family protein
VRAVVGELEEHHRAIFELAIEGYCAAEIGPRVGVTASAARRVLKRVRERLLAMNDRERSPG